MRVSVTVLAIALALGVAAIPQAGRAESPPPFPDFTFKRVKPPAPDAKKRITVQIAPVAPAMPEERAPSAPESVSPESGEAHHAWFWDALPEAAPGQWALRFQEAVQAVENGPLSAPSLGRLAAIAADHGPEILLATVGTGVSPALVLAVIAVESDGRSDAVSRAGAEGLMQLMPATATRFDVADSLDAPDNIAGGVAYLDWLLDEFDGDPVLALAGYNAGENTVKAAGGVPDYPETRAYVPKVLSAWTVARGLCKTPPELIGDGCVFVTDGSL